MKFSIVLIISISSSLMADSTVAQRVKNNPFFTASASLVAVGKRVRDLLWHRSDAMNEGLSGAAKIDAIDSEIDELAELTQGTFFGVLASAAKSWVLKKMPSAGDGLQDPETPIPARTQTASSNNNGNTQQVVKTLFFDDDDDNDSSSASPRTTAHSLSAHRNLFDESDAEHTDQDLSSSISSNLRIPQKPSKYRNEDDTFSTNVVQVSNPQPVKKLTELVSRVLSITAGASEIERHGLIPLVVDRRHWLEATHPDHPSMRDEHQASNFAAWRRANISTTQYLQQNQTIQSIRYLAPEEREQYQVFPAIHGSETTLFDRELNLLKNKTLLFVIGPDFKVYATEGQANLFHHSSFFAGGSVIWAGKITTNRDGIITTLSDESGHYLPKAVHTIQGFQVLQRLGYNLNNVRFEGKLELRDMSVPQYIASKTQEIAKSSALPAQSAAAAAAGASEPTLNETAR